MLNCWNEDPGKRPPFSKLRSQFDTMLLADKKNHYITLHIDHSSLCYQNITPSVITQEVDACKPTTSLNADPEHAGEYLHKSAGLSPSHGLRICSSTEGREDLVGSKQHLTPQKFNEASVDSTRRPVSLHLPYHDQNKQNPYVESPSQAACISLSQTTTRWGSDGAIKMEQL